MPLSASHPLARHAPEHWPGIGWNAGPASPESARSSQRESYAYELVAHAFAEAFPCQ